MRFSFPFSPSPSFFFSLLHLPSSTLPYTSGLYLSTLLLEESLCACCHSLLLHVVCSNFLSGQSHARWTSFIRCKHPSPKVTLCHFLPCTLYDPEDQNAVNIVCKYGRSSNSGSILDQWGEG